MKMPVILKSVWQNTLFGKSLSSGSSVCPDWLAVHCTGSVLWQQESPPWPTFNRGEPVQPPLTAGQTLGRGRHLKEAQKHSLCLSMQFLYHISMDNLVKCFESNSDMKRGEGEGKVCYEEVWPGSSRFCYGRVAAGKHSEARHKINHLKIIWCVICEAVHPF